MKAENFYRVHVGGKRYRYFQTLSAARRYCGKVCGKTGIVLAIELTFPKKNGGSI